MTVEEVLQRGGYPLGIGGRTTCPVHRGTNPQQFVYTERQWWCFSCGQGGGTVQLATLLQVRGIEGVPIEITEAVRGGRTGRVLMAVRQAALRWCVAWLDAITDEFVLLRQVEAITAASLAGGWPGAQRWDQACRDGVWAVDERYRLEGAFARWAHRVVLLKQEGRRR